MDANLFLTRGIHHPTRPMLGMACALKHSMSTKPLAHQVMPGAGDAESAAASQGAVRARDSFFHWCGTVEAIGQATNDADRRALVDAYFGSLADESVGPAARSFSGTLFPSEARTRSVPNSIIASAIKDLTRLDAPRRLARNPEVDLGDIAADAFAGRLPSGLAMSELGEWGDELARMSAEAEQQALVCEMLGRVSALEARYLVKLITGTLGAVVDAPVVQAAVERRRTQTGTSDRPGDRRAAKPRTGATSPARRRRRRAP